MLYLATHPFGSVSYYNIMIFLIVTIVGFLQEYLLLQSYHITDLSSGWKDWFNQIKLYDDLLYFFLYFKNQKLKPLFITLFCKSLDQFPLNRGL